MYLTLGCWRAACISSLDSENDLENEVAHMGRDFLRSDLIPGKTTLSIPATSIPKEDALTFDDVRDAVQQSSSGEMDPWKDI